MKTLFITILLSVGIYAQAQNSVKGRVTDAKDNSPISYATIALLHSDSSVVTGAVTGDDGRFVINNAATGDYLLEVSFLGYEKAYCKVNVPEQSELGDFLPQKLLITNEAIINK